MPGGHPPNYTHVQRREIIQTIAHRMTTTGNGITTILQADKTLPHYATITAWIADSEELLAIYARARADAADYLADEIITIADGIGNDPESVNRDRLRVDARKWVASKLKPRVYGDKLDVESRSTNTNISIQVVKFAGDTAQIDNIVELPRLE